MARRYITEQQALEVRRLLDEGELSSRTIARLSGVSKGTVNRIHRGERVDGATVHNSYAVEELEISPPAPPCRDRDCGACVTCRALEYRRERGLAC